MGSRATSTRSAKARARARDLSCVITVGVLIMQQGCASHRRGLKGQRVLNVICVEERDILNPIVLAPAEVNTLHGHPRRAKEKEKGKVARAKEERATSSKERVPGSRCWTMMGTVKQTGPHGTQAPGRINRCPGALRR